MRYAKMPDEQLGDGGFSFDGDSLSESDSSEDEDVLPELENKLNDLAKQVRVSRP